MKKILKVMGLFFKKTHMKFLCVVISLVLLASGVFFFENSLGRLVESCRDIGNSFFYSFCNLFKLDVTVDVTVNTVSDPAYLNLRTLYNMSIRWLCSVLKIEAQRVPILVPGEPVTVWEKFQEFWNKYWPTFIDTKTMLIYWYSLMYWLSIVLTVVMYVVPIFILIKKAFVKIYFKDKPLIRENFNFCASHETKPLRVWNFIYRAIFCPVGRWFLAFFDYVKKREALWSFWLLLALIYLNVFAIIFDALAYYIYFAAAQELQTLGFQFYKLYIDLHSLWKSAGICSWVALFVLFFNKKSIDKAVWEERTRLLQGGDEEC